LPIVTKVDAPEPGISRKPTVVHMTPKAWRCVQWNQNLDLDVEHGCAPHALMSIVARRRRSRSVTDADRNPVFRIDSP